jgi:mono/diheme cytochrome c family protein
VTKLSAMGLTILVMAVSLPLRAQHPGTEWSAANGAWHLYKKNCSGCHGFRGQGIFPVGVPLMGNAFVTGSRAEAIKAVIRNGRKGPEKAHGEYGKGGHMTMPAFEPVVISDRELDILAKYLKEGFQRGEFNQK